MNILIGNIRGMVLIEDVQLIDENLHLKPHYQYNNNYYNQVQPGGTATRVKMR